MKKILYISPIYPFPNNNGGDEGILKNIIELRNLENAEIYYIFTNLAKKEIIPPPPEFFVNSRYKIFDYQPKLKGWFDEIHKFWYAIFAPYPKTCIDIATKEVKAEIIDYNPDIIILSSLYCILALPKDLKNKKLIYIAHNIETEFALGLAKNTPFYSIYKLTRLLIALKIWFLEKAILNKADKIICVSSSDYSQLSKYSSKLILCPHKIDIKEKEWEMSEDKTLLFAGSIKSTFNYQAVKWLVEELSPKLSGTKIYITGTDTDKVPDNWKKYPNVTFKGRVSKEKLEEFYRTCTAYICPIDSGSGVKMKILDALGYGIPIIATEKALEGLKYLNIKPLLKLNNIESCVDNITGILNNPAELTRLHNDSLQSINDYQSNEQNKLSYAIEQMMNRL